MKKKLVVGMLLVVGVLLSCMIYICANTLSLESGGLWGNMGTYVQSLSGKYVVIGDDASGAETMDGDGDLYVAGELEVNANAF